MGFNVTAPGQKVTVYEGNVTVRLDVTRNEATGVKSHIIDIEKNEQDVVGLFCQITGQRPCCFVLYNHLLWITSYFIVTYWTETYIP